MQGHAVHRLGGGFAPSRKPFLGFSYGFRPGRRPHDALDALVVGLKTKKVNWVLDAEIKGFFDTLSHDWMIRTLGSVREAT